MPKVEFTLVSDQQQSQHSWYPMVLTQTHSDAHTPCTEESIDLMLCDIVMPNIKYTDYAASLSGWMHLGTKPSAVTALIWSLYKIPALILHYTRSRSSTHKHQFYSVSDIGGVQHGTRPSADSTLIITYVRSIVECMDHTPCTQQTISKPHMLQRCI